MEESIREKLLVLRIQDLDDDWVANLEETGFFEIGELPSFYQYHIEHLSISEILIDVITTIKQFLETQNPENNWSELSIRNEIIKYLAFLSYYIEHGKKNVLTTEHRVGAFFASRLYYSFLTIPGSTAYNVYHSQLFLNTLVCLTFVRTICEDQSGNKTRVVADTIHYLKDYVKDLTLAISVLNLKSSDQNFEEFLSSLLEIIGATVAYRLIIDRSVLESIVQDVYKLIEKLMCDKNGRTDPAAIKILFSTLLPKLISVTSDVKVASITLRTSYANYTGYMVETFGAAALKALDILLQHLCYTTDGLEKNEIRAARLSFLKEIIHFVPQRNLELFISWLITLSKTAKLVHRFVALECLTELLDNKSLEEPIEVIIKSEPETERVTRRSCTASRRSSASSRRDSTASSRFVRIIELTDSSEEDERPLVDFAAPPPNQPQPKYQRVPHGDMIRAIVGRVNDSSNHIRARALTIVTDCLTSTNQVISRAVTRVEQSEPSLFADIATRALEDERATVRRSAINMLHRIMSEAPQRTQCSYWEALVKYCRDSCISVRQVAVGALASLCSSGTDVAINSFLEGTLRQISDAEGKIQEEVVKSVETLMLNPIIDYTPDSAGLPWRLLDAAMKTDSKTYLYQALGILVKNKNNSKKLINALKNNLNASSSRSKKLFCLFLLNGIAKHVKYDKVDFLIDYYHQIAQSAEKSDTQSLIMTLDILSDWIDNISADKINALRSNVIDGISRGTWDSEGCRIPCSAFAFKADQTQTQWAIDLFRSAQKKALAGNNVDDWMRAADFSVICPDVPNAALIKKMLHYINKNFKTVDGCIIASLGRLCLRSHNAAAAAAPVLAKVLASSGSMSARSNALLTLSDIATRFTSIVEPQLDTMCRCIDRTVPTPLRRSAAKCLTQLLLGGYLRLRNRFYFRYCTLLADEDEEVREPVEYYVTSCLCTESIYHHFVDTILHYCNCKLRDGDVRENLSFDSRQLIYDLMLQRLTIVQKLNILCRLAQGILEYAANICDETISETNENELPPELNAALLDTITLFCGPRLKLPRKSQGDAGDIQELQERVASNIVSYKMKKTVAGLVVPAVLRLYERLRSGGGQIAAYLVKIANELLKDYKAEIADLIETNENLVENISHFQETIADTPTLRTPRKLIIEGNRIDPTTPFVRRPWQTPKKQTMSVSEATNSETPRRSDRKRTLASTRLSLDSSRSSHTPEPSNSIDTPRRRQSQSRTTSEQNRRSSCTEDSPQPGPLHSVDTLLRRPSQSRNSPIPSPSHSNDTTLRPPFQSRNSPKPGPSHTKDTSLRRLSQSRNSPKPGTSNSSHSPKPSTSHSSDSPNPGLSNSKHSSKSGLSYSRNSPKIGTSNSRRSSQSGSSNFKNSSEPGSSRSKHSPKSGPSNSRKSPKPSTSYSRHSPKPSTFCYRQSPQPGTSRFSQSPEPSTSRSRQSPKPGTSRSRHPSQSGTSRSRHSSQSGTSPSRQSPQPGTSRFRQSPQPGTSLRRQSSQPNTSSSRQSPQASTSCSRQSPQPGTSRSRHSPQPDMSRSRQSPQPGTSRSRQSPQPGTSLRRQSSQPNTSSSRQSPQASTSCSRQSPQPGTSRSRHSPQPDMSRSIQSPQPSTSCSIQSPQPGTSRSRHSPQPDMSRSRQSPQPGTSRSRHSPQPDMSRSRQSPQPSTSCSIQSPQPGTSRSRHSPQPDMSRSRQSPQPGTSRSRHSPQPDMSRSRQSPQPSTSCSIQSPQPGTSRSRHSPQPDMSRSRQSLQPSTSPSIQSPQPGTSRTRQSPQPGTSQSIDIPLSQAFRNSPRPIRAYSKDSLCQVPTSDNTSQPNISHSKDTSSRASSLSRETILRHASTSQLSPGATYSKDSTKPCPSHSPDPRSSPLSIPSSSSSTKSSKKRKSSEMSHLSSDEHIPSHSVDISTNCLSLTRHTDNPSGISTSSDFIKIYKKRKPSHTSSDSIDDSPKTIGDFKSKRSIKAENHIKVRSDLFDDKKTDKVKTQQTKPKKVWRRICYQSSSDSD